MKQIVQDLKSGKTILEEVPAPVIQPGHVLIKTHTSLVSLGTERMLVEFGKAGYIQKARQQPEKVKQVIDKIKTDGLRPTMDAVFRKLNEPLPLGYSNAGEVIGIGKGVHEFRIGQRVVSNGPHAEFISIPENLVAGIPNGVSYEEACFTVVGAIGLQGIRLINPTFGETIVVIGLGLIGLITVQLLKANGCVVIGFDLDDNKVQLALALGINAKRSDHNMVTSILQQTMANGADGVIITTSTKSNEVISDAAQMSRKKGRIVLVGVTGLDIKRSDFYEKELTFQVSCSYGPGRYDNNYEQKGIDYPLAFVRWTEKRNFQAVLNAIRNKNLNVLPLISERVELNEFESIYENIQNSKSIASILVYNADNSESGNVIALDNKSYASVRAVIGIIGAGNFTGATILPVLKKVNATVKSIASVKGLSGTTLAKKFRISNSTTNYQTILSDDDISLVLITTRHHLHAHMVVEALIANKHVFVEKPLALNKKELNEILNAYQSKQTSLTVGFNRRFAPLAIRMKQVLGNGGTPINIIATMNAGAIQPGSWVHDLETGGGRIIGEACHLFDLCTFLAGSKIKSVCMNSMGTQPDEQTDNASILLKYTDGTNAVINYFSNGSKAYSKERVEVFSQGRTLIMDNWKKLEGFGFEGFSSTSSGQDKGHENLFRRLLVNMNSGGKAIIPIDEIINTTLATFAAIESLKTGDWVDIEQINSSEGI